MLVMPGVLGLLCQMQGIKMVEHLGFGIVAFGVWVGETGGRVG